MPSINGTRVNQSQIMTLHQTALRCDNQESHIPFNMAAAFLMQQPVQQCPSHLKLLQHDAEARRHQQPWMRFRGPGPGRIRFVGRRSRSLAYPMRKTAGLKRTCGKIRHAVCGQLSQRFPSAKPYARDIATALRTYVHHFVHFPCAPNRRFELLHGKVTSLLAAV